MKRKMLKIFAASMVMGLVSSSALAGHKSEGTYSITLTNLTRGTLFTPAVAITHASGIKSFEVGEAASAEIGMLAEGGATQPLQDAIYATGKAFDAANSGPVFPGKSVTITVQTKDDAEYITLGSMMLPTNDGFIALNGVKGPKEGKTRVFYLRAYDAGTETNDELCANIPGPHCGGVPFSDGQAEGYVHIHAGIHGIGDLNAADYDWRNPVAKVTVVRMK